MEKVMTQTFQISHAELLLLLGLLELPRPFALGQSALPERPVLEGVLSAAAGSLAARDLLTMPTQPDQQPQPLPELATVLRVSALAEHLLIVASGPPTRLCHISRADKHLVMHTSPMPDVHRFALLPGAGQVLETLLTTVMPVTLPEPAIEQPLLVNGEALLTAFNALQRNELNLATSLIEQQGHPSEVARMVVKTVGPQPTRHALVAIRKLRQPDSVARGAMVIAGQHGGWWIAPESDGSDLLALWPIGGRGMRARVSEFGAWICEAA
jgi:hypothetical protein